MSKQRLLWSVTSAT